MIEVLDQVALWVGRVILDGIGFFLLICGVIFTAEVQDRLRRRKRKRDAEKETAELTRMYGGGGR